MNTRMSSDSRPISMGPACDLTNLCGSSEVQSWGQTLGGLFLIGFGIRQNNLMGGILASAGSCLAYKGVCNMFAARPRVGSTTPAAEQPDPTVVNNPVDEASWESFPASDAPFFSGITR